MSDSNRLADRSPLPTVPSQSESEKSLHRDPEYCALVRVTVSGLRDYRERRVTGGDSHETQSTEVSRQAPHRTAWSPKRVNARALAEREGWTPGVLLSSSKWRNGSRKLLEVCADGVWITEGERGAHGGRGGKRCLVDTLPQDTRAVEGGPDA